MTPNKRKKKVLKSPTISKQWDKTFADFNDRTLNDHSLLAEFQNVAVQKLDKIGEVLTRIEHQVHRLTQHFE